MQQTGYETRRTETCFKPIDEEVKLFAFDESYEVDPDCVTILSTEKDGLGSGFYGSVVLARMSLPQKIPILVALKMPKYSDNPSPSVLQSQINAIKEEISILSTVGGHENVLKLMGTLTKEEDKFGMLTEYCAHGSLLSLLQTARATDRFVSELLVNATGLESYIAQADQTWLEGHHDRRKEMIITTSDLFHFAYQIANGMAFLSAKQIVHRDLALRNVLITDDYTAKIADFGLARKTPDGKYYFQTRHFMPFAWTAPEVTFQDYVRVSSDLWTFGVVLWELFELGKQPYGGFENQQAILNFLGQGGRLMKPEYAPKVIYELMLQLWKIRPRDRPSLLVCQRIIGKELLLSNKMVSIYPVYINSL